MEILYYFLTTLFVIVCLFLIMLILIQKGRGGGLSGAFGGGGGGSTAFGSKTGDVLTWATSVVFGVFLLLAISLNLLANHMGQIAKAPASNVTPATQPTTQP
jgi:preprotein translocase subunit SecG